MGGINIPNGFYENLRAQPNLNPQTAKLILTANLPQSPQTIALQQNLVMQTLERKTFPQWRQESFDRFQLIKSQLEQKVQQISGMQDVPENMRESLTKPLETIIDKLDTDRESFDPYGVMVELSRQKRQLFTKTGNPRQFLEADPRSAAITNDPAMRLYADALGSVQDALGPIPGQYQVAPRRVDYPGNAEGAGTGLKAAGAILLAGGALMTILVSTLSRKKGDPINWQGPAIYVGLLALLLNINKLQDQDVKEIREDLQKGDNIGFQSAISTYGIRGKDGETFVKDVVYGDDDELQEKMVTLLNKDSKATDDEKKALREEIIKQAPSGIQDGLRKMATAEYKHDGKAINTFDSFLIYLRAPQSEQTREILAYSVLKNATAQSVAQMLKQMQMPTT